MNTNNNNDFIHTIYFLEHSFAEYPDCPSEEVIKKRKELEQQLKNEYQILNRYI